MDWLNYHHLLYFWMVAKTGSITRAGQELRLARPTISAQIHALEETLGEKLFTKTGRRLQLTEVGQLVFGYADEIFSLGRELMDVLKERPRGRAARLVVGISDMMPKLVAYRILQPALTLATPVHLVCYEDQPEKLLLSLAAHELDLVLTDAPAHSSLRVRVFSHLLGSSGVALFAAPQLVALPKGFSQSAGRRTVSDAHARFDITPDTGSVAGYAQDSAAYRRRVSGQGSAECIRAGGNR